MKPLIFALLPLAALSLQYSVDHTLIPCNKLQLPIPNDLWIARGSFDLPSSGDSSSTFTVTSLSSLAELQCPPPQTDNNSRLCHVSRIIEAESVEALQSVYRNFECGQRYREQLTLYRADSSASAPIFHYDNLLIASDSTLANTVQVIVETASVGAR